MPPIEHLVEAGICADDLEAAGAFYGGVLGPEFCDSSSCHDAFFATTNDAHDQLTS